jgi:hypothetical protein
VLRGGDRDTHRPWLPSNDNRKRRAPRSCHAGSMGSGRCLVVATRRPEWLCASALGTWRAPRHSASVGAGPSILALRRPGRYRGIHRRGVAGRGGPRRFGRNPQLRAGGTRGDISRPT